MQGGFVADKSRERLADRAVVKPDTVPDAEREAAAVSEHAAHLPHGTRLIGKKLQSLLAENRVHGGVPNRRSSAPPATHSIDAPTGAGSDCATAIMAGVQIDPYDTSGRTDPFRRSASHDAGPASNVQHALADADVSDIDKQGRPRSEDVASDVALVQFGRLCAQLPLPVRGHLPFHPSLRDIRSAVCVTALIWA